MQKQLPPYNLLAQFLRLNSPTFSIPTLSPSTMEHTIRYEPDKTMKKDRWHVTEYSQNIAAVSKNNYILFISYKLLVFSIGLIVITYFCTFFFLCAHATSFTFTFIIKHYDTLILRFACMRLIYRNICSILTYRGRA